MRSILDPTRRAATRDGARVSVPWASLTEQSLPALLGLLTIASVVAWGAALPSIDLGEMTDLGLVSVLPPAFYLAIAFATASFVLALRVRPLPRLTLALNVVVLIFFLYGTVPLVADELSFTTAWLHAGFAEAIARTGDLFPERDARFSWPAFFALAAYVSEIGGFGNPVQIAAWSPVVLNLLFLGPLLLIFRSATGDPRLVWLATWFFYCVNWVGQDYFSPQGFNFLLYLAFFAVVLAVFRSPLARIGWVDRLQHRAGLIKADEPGGIPDAETVPTIPYSAAARAALVLVLVLVFMVITSSHQLTPFAALGGMLMLVLFSRTSLKGMPLVMMVILTTWLSYMTVTFLAGHLEGLLDDIGRTEDMAASNVANRIRGSFEHQLVVYVRLMFTLLVWMLALGGGIRRLFNRHLELTFGLLALAPFGLLALQSYGGEMLLRVFLFSMPFMAFLAAAGFFPHDRPRRTRWSHSVLIAATTTVLVMGLLVTRYGNMRADYMSVGEATAAERLYEVAEPGSLLATVNFNAPLRYRQWEAYRYRVLRDEVLTGDVDDVLVEMRRHDGPEAYLFVSRSQRAFAQLFIGTGSDVWDRVIGELRAAREFELVYENADAVILRLRDEVAVEP